MLRLVLVILAAAAAVINAQYTCPSYQVGRQVGGAGLGGANGYYQATSLAQCCYNCLVVFAQTCAGFNYYSAEQVCFLASSISVTVTNLNSDVSSGTNPSFSASATTTASTASTSSSTLATTTTTLATTTLASGTTTATAVTGPGGAPTTTTLAGGLVGLTTTFIGNCFVAPGSNLVGSDLFQVLAPTLAACCSKCASAVTPQYRCIGFAYQASTQTCSLKYLDPTSNSGLNVNAGSDFTTGVVLGIGNGR